LLVEVVATIVPVATVVGVVDAVIDAVVDVIGLLAAELVVVVRTGVVEAAVAE